MGIYINNTPVAIAGGAVYWVEDNSFGMLFGGGGYKGGQWYHSTANGFGAQGFDLGGAGYSYDGTVPSQPLYSDFNTTIGQGSQDTSGSSGANTTLNLMNQGSFFRGYYAWGGSGYVDTSKVTSVVQTPGNSNTTYESAGRITITLK